MYSAACGQHQSQSHVSNSPGNFLLTMHINGSVHWDGISTLLQGFSQARSLTMTLIPCGQLLCNITTLTVAGSMPPESR